MDSRHGLKEEGPPASRGHPPIFGGPCCEDKSLLLFCRAMRFCVRVCCVCFFFIFIVLRGNRLGGVGGCFNALIPVFYAFLPVDVWIS